MPELLPDVPPPTWRARLTELSDRARDRPLAAAGAVAAVVVAVALGFVLLRPAPAAPAAVVLPRASADGGGGVGGVGAESSSSRSSAPAERLVVHVAGAVRTPGLVRLPAGARVADAVGAAGGLLDEADVDRLNLAAPLADGERLYVPARGQEVPPDVTGAAGPGGPAGPDPPGGRSGSAGAVVDLNTATEAELEALPGVGPATAAAILDHRRQHGRFRSVEELLDVRGIGEARLAQLRPRVRI